MLWAWEYGQKENNGEKTITEIFKCTGPEFQINGERRRPTDLGPTVIIGYSNSTDESYKCCLLERFCKTNGPVIWKLSKSELCFSPQNGPDELIVVAQLMSASTQQAQPLLSFGSAMQLHWFRCMSNRSCLSCITTLMGILDSWYSTPVQISTWRQKCIPLKNAPEALTVPALPRYGRASTHITSSHSTVKEMFSYSYFPPLDFFTYH